MRTSFCRILLAVALALPTGLALAESYVAVCYNWGCKTRQSVGLPESWIRKTLAPLRQAKNPEQERAAVADVVRQFYVKAAEQTPIGADQPGNEEDESVVGRMDCIDHSSTTRNLLSFLQHKEALRWHQVGPYAHRALLVFSHYSATLVSIDPDTEAGGNQVYVVDPWMVEPGELPEVANVSAWAGHRFYSLETQHHTTSATPLAGR